MREKAVTFGPDRSLVGVWSRPEAAESPPFTLLMLSAGVIHSVGVWRLHTRLARALDDAAVPSLRFDLSGVGDSLQRSNAATLEELVQQDIEAAIDFVEAETGRRDVILLGLCSGARDALDAAARSDAVRGVVCIDLIADFRVWQHHLIHYVRRIWRRESWANTLAGRNNLIQRMMVAIRPRPATSPDLPHAMLGLRPLLERDVLRRCLEGLLDRGCKALFVFSGGLPGNYNHRSQFASALPRVARHPDVTLHFHGEADHTFSDPDRQSLLIRRIRAWLVATAEQSSDRA